MSRSGYSDDGGGWELVMWRGAVNSAIKGKRGQALLVEMADTLDSMPIKRLVANNLATAEGEVCALGAVAKARGIKVEGVDPEDSDAVASLFGVARALVCEIAAENDLDFYAINETPEERWKRMRTWVGDNLMAISIIQEKA